MLSSWNVRTLHDSDHSTCPERRTALVARELKRYRIDIAALSETKLPGEGQLTEVHAGYTFFWSGKAEQERCEAGVGFAIRTSLLPKLDTLPHGINERIMTVRLALSLSQYATIISVYAPTMTHTDESKEKFYSDLTSLLQKVPRHDKIILMGDFNARVGCVTDAWRGVLGAHGIGKMNSNGLLLLSLCQEFKLTVTNTIFQAKNIYKGTWKHPRAQTWHMIDYILVRQQDLHDVHITRAMRGADCWTDHRMVRSVMNLKLQKTVRPQGNHSSRRLDVQKLLIPKIQEAFQSTLAQAVTENLTTIEDMDISEHWQALKTVTYESAKATAGIRHSHHQDWFDENDDLIEALLAEKHAAHKACLNDPSSDILRSNYSRIRSTVQTMLRTMRDEWWAQKAEEIQLHADKHDMKSFYAALREVYGPSFDTVSPVLTKDGQSLLVEKEKILARWAEHFNDVLNIPSTCDLATFEAMPQLPIQNALDLPPTLQEVETVIKVMKNGKSPGADGITAEVLKAGGSTMTVHLLELYKRYWSQGCLPQDFKDASIVHLFKRKGARTVCDNHRGISLLSVPGKVLSKIIASRLYRFIADPYLSESQCGFRPNRGCVDMIFTTRQLIEKCREQNVGLCATFIDLTKAFDSVNRDGLWKLLAKLGCPDKFLSMIREFHDGMSARVIEHGTQSDPFPVTNGVKQGCTMAPTLFAIFFAAMLHEAFRDIDIGIYIQYRTSGKLFNLRRLQASSKITEALIRELLFADDCGLCTHTVEDMQILMNRFSTAAQQFGLTISVKKTQVMYIPPPGVQYTIPVVTVGQETLQAVEQFTYLGSTVSSDCSIDAEVTNRIAKASSSFGALTSKLWNMRGIRNETKLAVYHAVVLPCLLYASETWTYYRRHVRQLDRFHLSCLRKIMNVRWQDRVSNVEVLQRARTVGMEALLIKAKLRWVGHVVRMDDSRIPKQVFYAQLKNGKRRPGGQLLRYKDGLKNTLKSCQVDVNTWEKLCEDRSGWRQLTLSSIEKFEATRIEALVQKRQIRKGHAATLPSVAAGASRSVFTCTECGRMCLSRIGLFGHMRVHRRS